MLAIIGEFILELFIEWIPKRRWLRILVFSLCVLVALTGFYFLVLPALKA